MIKRFISYQSYQASKKILKRLLEYLIIIILCIIIASIVFAYEFQEFDGFFDQQMYLNAQLVEAIEILAEKVTNMEKMRGI